MTLSRFLRDYLFVPMATGSWLPYPRFTGMVITMFLAGLWHGASWNFAVWGLYQGIALAGYTLLDRRFRQKLPAWLGWACTMLFWVEGSPLFRGENFGSALAFYRAMHGGGLPIESINGRHIVLLIVSGLLAVLGPSSQAIALQRLHPRPAVAALAGIALFVAFFVIGSEVEQEFIYFRF
jgi:D-alanyl-lipoteichoic acid acyltransferase DltB (MBOAT superfamily)